MLADFPLIPFIFTSEDVAFNFVSVFKKVSTRSVRNKVFNKKVIHSEEGLLTVIKCLRESDIILLF